MNSHWRSNSKSEGFTLVEVLISIVLLSMISLAIYQATLETFKVRDKLTGYGDFYNGIRLAFAIMERDIALIYNPQITLPPKAAPIPGQPVDPQKDAQERQEILKLFGDEAMRSSLFWGPVQDLSGAKPSLFKGTENKMTFITVSNTRIYKDSPESIFTKITYEMLEGKTILKTADTNAFETDDGRESATVRKFPLIQGITKLKYRYYRKDKDQWNTSWDSEKDDLVGKFPDIIEITVEVDGEQRLHFDGIYKFRPEIPLNGLNPST